MLALLSLVNMLALVLTCESINVDVSAGRDLAAQAC